MITGISLYPGLDRLAKENKTLLEKAASRGIRRVFTSLQIPEADATALQQELQDLLALARSYDMDVIADLSPASCQMLGLASLDGPAIQAMGITTGRFDFGLDAPKAALWSHILNVQLNASTVTQDYIAELHRCGADFHHIDCLHNFYPRPHTGLSEEYFLRRTNWLQSQGLSVGAFIASKSGRRGPLHEGLPTLEGDRSRDVSLAARHLQSLGIDSVLIGDDAPTDAELDALVRAANEERNVVAIKVRLTSRDPHMYDLLSHTFTARPDEAADVIRAQESRALAKDYDIEPKGLFRPLHRGDITVDNSGFLRYKGEVQIVRHDLPAEPRTNIVATVLPEELFLLDYITPRKKFRFEIIR